MKQTHAGAARGGPRHRREAGGRGGEGCETHDSYTWKCSFAVSGQGECLLLLN